MKYFLAVAVAAFVIAVHAFTWVVSTVSAERYLVSYGTEAWAPWAAGGVEIGKAVMLAAAVWFLTRRRFDYALMGAAVGVVWLGLVAASMLATKATITTSFEAVENAGQLSQERRATLKAEAADLERQLAWVATLRPVEVAQGELDTLKVQRPWLWSEGCRNVTNDTRAFCERHAKLAGEVAGAGAARDIRDRLAGVRQQLGETGLKAAVDPMVATWNALLGKLIPIGGKDGLGALAILVAELTSCIGLTAVAMIWQWRPTQVAEATNRDRQPSAPLVAEALPALTATVTADALPEAPPVAAVEPVEPSSARETGALDGLPARVKAIALRASNDVDNPPYKPAVDCAADRPARVALQIVGGHAASFVEACLEPAEGAALQAATIWSAYEQWCRETGVEPVTQTRLGIASQGVV